MSQSDQSERKLKRQWNNAKEPQGNQKDLEVLEITENTRTFLDPENERAITTDSWIKDLANCR